MSKRTQKRPIILRLPRQDPHEETSYNPTTKTYSTRLDDARRYDLIRTDILMVYDGKVQRWIYPKKDGTWYAEKGVEEHLTDELRAWLDNEARMIAERWKEFPELFRFLR